jgi:D-3-phosphoglycerate dehydrogenase
MDLKQCRLLVTPTSYAKADPGLRRLVQESCGEVIFNDSGKPLKAADLSHLLAGVDGYIAGVDEISSSALEHADRLKVISRYGVGVDNVDLDAAQRRGILVTNTPGANAISVAELTIGLLFSLARQIPEAIQATRQCEWPRLSGVSLYRKTVGLVGLGMIGKHVAKRLKNFECQVLAYDTRPDRDFAREWQIELVELDDLLARADFVSLHLAASADTRGMVDDGFLARMKPGAFLINTSRGDCLDEGALIRAIQQGHLRGAALDVFSEEPPCADNPILKMKQIIVTPHTGAHTDDAMNAMGWMSTEDCLAVLQGQEPRYRVI